MSVTRRTIPVGTTLATDVAQAFASANDALIKVVDELNTHLDQTRMQGLAFASLPASPRTGTIAHITDSNTVTWGATIAGGGTNKVLGFYNGTNWTVAGI